MRLAPGALGVLVTNKTHLTGHIYPISAYLKEIIVCPPIYTLQFKLSNAH